MGSVARTASRPSKPVGLFLNQHSGKILIGLPMDHADSQSKSIIMNTASAEETRRNDDWFGDEAETEKKRYG